MTTITTRRATGNSIALKQGVPVTQDSIDRHRRADQCDVALCLGLELDTVAGWKRQANSGICRLDVGRPRAPVERRSRAQDAGEKMSEFAAEFHRGPAAMQRGFCPAAQRAASGLDPWIGCGAPFHFEAV
jgi:hypothetical protein